MNIKKVLILFAIVLSIVACNKDDNENSKFIGKWEIVKVSGGLSGKGYTPYFKYLYFVDNDACKWTNKNDKFIVDGTYSLRNKSGKDYISFYPKNDTAIYNFYSHKLEYEFLSNDSLYMNQGCCDLYDYIFVKVK